MANLVYNNLTRGIEDSWCILSVIPGTTSKSGQSTQKGMVTFQGQGAESAATSNFSVSYLWDK